MLWRTSPAATELEDVTLGWLRKMLGLPDAFHGIVYDTASIGGFSVLAAARERLGLDIRTRGMAGRGDLPVLRVYITDHTHSHVEKGAIALGIGRDNVVRVPVDEDFAMRPDALAQALDADLARGYRPMCVDRDGRHDLDHLERSDRGDQRGDARARRVAARRRGVRRPGGDPARVPLAARPGARGRLDRGQPAQVAVRADRPLGAVPARSRAAAAHVLAGLGRAGHAPRPTCTTTWTTACSSGAASAPSSCGSRCAPTA